MNFVLLFLWQVTFCSSDAAFRDECVKFCTAEMVEWLCTEQTLNKQSPMPPSQKAFWCPPPESAHDPRGQETFIKEFVVPYRGGTEDPTLFHPHANIAETAERAGAALVPAVDSVGAETGDMSDASATAAAAVAPQ